MSRANTSQPARQHARCTKRAERAMDRTAYTDNYAACTCQGHGETGQHDLGHACPCLTMLGYGYGVAWGGLCLLCSLMRYLFFRRFGVSTSNSDNKETTETSPAATKELEQMETHSTTADIALCPRVNIEYADGTAGVKAIRTTNTSPVTFWAQYYSKNTTLVGSR